MRIKGLIAIDLDGTLLPSDGTLSKESERILSSLSDQGYMIVLATGRPLRSLLPSYDRLRCFGPVIAYNGAHRFHPTDPSFPAKKRVFPKELVHKIFDIAKQKEEYSFMAETDSVRYCSRKDDCLDPYFPPENIQTRFISEASQIEEDLNTCVVLVSEADKEKIRGLLKLEKGVSLRNWSASPYSELFFPEETKGEALREIAGFYGCPKEDIYAFGDADNDVSMLECAGHPYAMKGCKSKALSSAFPSTKKGCSEDGVAFELSILFNL